MDTTTSKLTDQERTELLDWVSACQSAYHIDSTPGHRFGGLPSNLQENRDSLVEHVESIIQARADHSPDVGKMVEPSAISTLLQCPFCSADSIRASGGEGDRKRYGTHCSALKCPGANFGLFHNSQEAADLAWNTRTCPTVPDGLPAVLTDWGFDVHDDEEGRTWLTIRNPDDDVARMSVPTVWPLNGNQTIGAVVLHQLSAALNAALSAAQAKVDLT